MYHCTSVSALVFGIYFLEANDLEKWTKAGGEKTKSRQQAALASKVVCLEPYFREYLNLHIIFNDDISCFHTQLWDLLVSYLPIFSSRIRFWLKRLLRADCCTVFPAGFSTRHGFNNNLFLHIHPLSRITCTINISLCI